MGVGASFVGKVTSLDISDIVYLSGVSALSSLFQDPAIVFRQAVTSLPGVCVCCVLCVCVCVYMCCVYVFETVTSCILTTFELKEYSCV